MVFVKTIRRKEAREEYYYSATGEKIAAIHRWNPNYSTSPVIGSAVNTSNLRYMSKIQYHQNLEYNEYSNLIKLKFDNGYYSYIDNKSYVYIKDHLGNTRVVADINGNVVQRTDYDPFGMTMPTSTNQSVQAYKYNGKEFADQAWLNLYDYGSRWYDPARAQFTTMDPLAEKYPWMSPYAYCLNNPLKYVDTKGMSPEEGIISKLANQAIAFATRAATATVTAATSYILREAKEHVSNHVSPYVEVEAKIVVGPKLAANVKGVGVDIGYRSRETGLTLEIDKTGVSNAETHGRKMPTEKYTNSLKVGAPIPVAEGWSIGVEAGGKSETVVEKATNQTLSTGSEQSIAVTPYALWPIALEYKNINTTVYESGKRATEDNSKRLGISTGFTGVLFVGFEFNLNGGIKYDTKK